MKAVLSHLDDIVSTTSVEALWDLHTTHMAAFGFDRLIYGYTRYNTLHSLGDPQDWVLLTNHDPDYMRAFLDDGLLFQAPIPHGPLGLGK